MTLITKSFQGAIFAVEGKDFVISVIEGWPNQIVHRRIDNEEMLSASAFHKFHSSDQNPRVAGNKSARLHENPQPKRLEQWQQAFRVFDGRQDIGRRGGLPPMPRSA